MTLGELLPRDADTLAFLFSDAEMGRSISPPPATANDFSRLVLWAQEPRESGTVFCLGVVPEFSDTAVGILQLHELEVSFRTAEWGFVIGRPYWGPGLFGRSAHQRVLGDGARIRASFVTIRDRAVPIL